jgi:uncharacterized membrane protein
MLLADVIIATLVIFPLVAHALALTIPWAELELSDLRLPLLIAIAFALAVRAWREGWWQRLPAEARARVPLEAAVCGAVLGALALVWRLLGFDLEVALWHLSYGSGAVPFAALAAVAGSRWAGASLEDSFFLRHGAALWSRWRAAVERAPMRALWSAAAVVGALYLWVALVRHHSFDSHGWDLGIFTNAMWNLTHGHGYISSVKGGINLFADHQSPLFWVLAPVFWLVPRPETLLVVQAWGLAAGGPALYYIALARFGRGHWTPAALPWLYWSYLPLRYANAFDFHPEVFMLPLFLWAFVAFNSQRRGAKWLGLLALAGALGAKESAAVVAIGLGAAWVLSSPRPWRERWPGVALAAFGAAVVLFDLKVVPRFFGSDYAYMGLYQRFGGGILDVLLAPLTQPRLFFSQLISLERLNFLFWTLAPLGFLPLFAWRAAVAALPVYLMLFLTAGDQRVQIHFHYGIEPGTALFWALPFGLAAFAGRFGWRRTALWMLFWALACLRPFEAGLARFYEVTPHMRWVAAEALPCVDPAAAMSATDVLIPHLATRGWINYPYALAQRSGQPVSCVVTDLKLNNWPIGSGGVEQVLATLPASGYREAYRCRSFSVYERGEARCLRCKPDCR